MNNQILLINTVSQNNIPFTEHIVNHGFEFTYCDSIIEGLYQLKNHQFSLIILNVVNPQLTDLTVIEQFKKISITPIIVFTNIIEPPHLLQALTLGAHDYLLATLDPREILARIYIHIGQHTVKTEETNKSKIYVNNVLICTKTRTAYCEKQLLNLTGLEFELLYLLISNAGLIVTRKIISKCIFKKSLSVNDRSLDMHISNLRKKMTISATAIKAPHLKKIKTVRGNGYVFLK